ncbi:ABC transporter permease [Pseudomonas sp. R2.Fl]|nr:ABC transporter permease [Pseudomonas sp. R2.Fl]
MRIRHIYQLGIKELRGLLRDWVLLVLIVYAFTFSVYMASKAMPESLNMAAIAIVDEDQSPLSYRITDSFYPPYFTKPVVTTIAGMDDLMDAGLVTFALTIPDGFQADVIAGRVPEIQLNVDATRMSQAFNGSNYIQSIVTNEVTEFVQRYRGGPDMPVDLVIRSRFNPELNRTWFGSIHDIINNVTMLSIILTGAALIREREHGTIEHLLVMPVTALEIMLSKILSMTLVVFVASAFSLVVIVQGFLSVPIEGSMWLFLAGALLQMLATNSMGIFLATMAGSMPQFGLLLMMVLLPMTVLSGGTTPYESMPLVIQRIMLVSPDTHFTALSQAILFRGAGIDVVWPQFIALLLIGSVLFIVALRRFRAFLK